MVILFSTHNTVDRGLMFFILILMLIVVVVEIFKRLFNWFLPIEKLLEQFNKKLLKQEEVIDAVRKAYAFQKVKSGVFSIQYFKMLGLEKEMKKEMQGLIEFGLDKELVNNEKQLADFLVDLGNCKYQIKVDTKSKKFIFIKKEK